jgi:hypothetical protein
MATASYKSIRLNADNLRFIQAEIRKARSYEHEAFLGKSDNRTTLLVIQGLRHYYNELSNELSGTRNIALQQADIKCTLDDYEKQLRAETITKSKDELLESFLCKINRIDGDTAYISLIDGRGHQAVAEYDARELANYGLSELALFKLNINRRRNETVAIIEPVRSKKLSADEVKAIRDRINSLLGDYDPRKDL